MGLRLISVGLIPLVVTVRSPSKLAEANGNGFHEIGITTRRGKNRDRISRVDVMCSFKPAKIEVRHGGWRVRFQHQDEVFPQERDTVAGFVRTQEQTRTLNDVRNSHEKVQHRDSSCQNSHSSFRPSSSVPQLCRMSSSLVPSRPRPPARNTREANRFDVSFGYANRNVLATHEIWIEPTSEGGPQLQIVPYVFRPPPGESQPVS